MQNMQPIHLAHRLLGGTSALGRACGVTPQCVVAWMNGSRPVPVKRALLIEAATDGRVDRFDLCPDIFGPRPKKASGRR